MYLLDTNICIYLMKNTYPHMIERILRLSPGDIFVSAITVFELEYGASKSNWGERTKNQLRFFLAPFTMLSFQSNDAVIAGHIRADLATKGTPIGPYDVQLAAQALSHNLTLVTKNVREFSRVQNLLIEDWTSE